MGMNFEELAKQAVEQQIQIGSTETINSANIDFVNMGEQIIMRIICPLQHRVIAVPFDRISFSVFARNVATQLETG